MTVGEVFKLFGVLELVGGKETVTTLVDADKKAKTLGDTFSTIARPANALRVGITAIGTALTTALGIGIQQTNDLNQLMSKFQAETGESAKEVERWKTVVQAAYRTNLNSYEEIVGAVTALRTEMQMTADEARDELPLYMDFAKVIGSDVAASIRQMDDVGDAWNLTAERSRQLMDQLIVSHQQYGGSVQDNLTALINLAPAAQALGMDLDHTIGLLNLFAKSGLDAASATMAFSYAAKTFKSPEEFQRALDTLSQTEDATKRAQLAAQIFGARAGVAFSNAFSPGKEKLDAFIVSLDESAGAAERAGRAFDDNFNTKLQLFLRNVGGRWQEFIDNMGPGVTALASAFTALGTLFPNLGSGLLQLAGKAGVVRKAIDLLTGSFNPFLVGGVIIVGIITLIKKLQEAGEEARKAARDISRITDVEEAADQVKFWEKELERFKKAAERIRKSPQLNPEGMPSGQGPLAQALKDVERAAAKLAEARKKLTELTKEVADATGAGPGSGSEPPWTPSGEGNTALKAALDRIDRDAARGVLTAGQQLRELETAWSKYSGDAKTTTEQLLNLEKRLQDVRKALVQEVIDQVQTEAAYLGIDLKGDQAAFGLLKGEGITAADLASAIFEGQPRELGGYAEAAEAAAAERGAETWSPGSLRGINQIDEDALRYAWESSDDMMRAGLAAGILATVEALRAQQRDELGSTIDAAAAERESPTAVGMGGFRALEDALQRNASVASEVAAMTREEYVQTLGWWDRSVIMFRDGLGSVTDGIKSKLGGAVEWLGRLMRGDFAGALVEIIAKTRTFRNLIALFAKVAQPLIDLLDAILMPILKFVAGVWNAIINALAGISIFGWKPFKGLKKYLITWDEKGDIEVEDDGEEVGEEPGGGQGSAGSQGTQISEITGPTRDLLVDLLTPLSSLQLMVGMMSSIRDVLMQIRDGILGGLVVPGQGVGLLAAAGAGGSGQGGIVLYGDINIYPQTLADVEQLATALGQGVTRQTQAMTGTTI